MENDAENISNETMRQEWEKYKNEILTTPQYNVLWENLESKFELDKKDIFLILFKKFIKNDDTFHEKVLFNRIHINAVDKGTIVFKGLTHDERKHIHLLCDKIGLHHESKNHPKKHKKILYVYKPKIWVWEYTEKNPYSKSKEYYEQREKEYKQREEEKQQRLKERLSKKYCYSCNKNGYETNLFQCRIIRGLYCDDCIETLSDGYGGELRDHDFDIIN